jgi:hypothetical protein
MLVVKFCHLLSQVMNLLIQCFLTKAFFVIPQKWFAIKIPDLNSPRQIVQRPPIIFVVEKCYQHKALHLNAKNLSR